MSWIIKALFLLIIISSMTPEDWVVLDDGHDPIVKSKFKSLYSSYASPMKLKRASNKRHETKKNISKPTNHNLCISKSE